jgi:MFS-type transporter involved in bile tolerance (Atg22 family)
MNKKIFSWALYDWANSVFYTTVMAGFFPVFFKKYWSGESEAILSTERLGWILVVSGFLLAILSPTMGLLSDKKKMRHKDKSTDSRNVLMASFFNSGSSFLGSLFLYTVIRWLIIGK